MGSYYDTGIFSENSGACHQAVMNVTARIDSRNPSYVLFPGNTGIVKDKVADCATPDTTKKADI